MAQLAFIVVVLALAGALASWVAGAWFYAQTLRELSSERGQPRLAWLAVVAWPFATGRIKGAAAALLRRAPPKSTRHWSPSSPV